MKHDDIQLTKELISLAGSLDWRFRNGRSTKDIKPIIKKMRTNLTKIENIVKNESG